MNDLATFVIINLDGGKKMPEELLKTLEENGWMMVKDGCIFALPWDKILRENNTNAQDLLTRIENVRVTLKRLGVEYKIRTMLEEDSVT